MTQMSRLCSNLVTSSGPYGKKYQAQRLAFALWQMKKSSGKLEPKPLRVAHSVPRP